MSWTGHVAREGRRKLCIKVLSINVSERDHFRDLDLGWRIILDSILNACPKVILLNRVLNYVLL